MKMKMIMITTTMMMMLRKMILLPSFLLFCFCSSSLLLGVSAQPQQQQPQQQQQQQQEQQQVCSELTSEPFTREVLWVFQLRGRPHPQQQNQNQQQLPNNNQVEEAQLELEATIMDTFRCFGEGSNSNSSSGSQEEGFYEITNITIRMDLINELIGPKFYNSNRTNNSTTIDDESRRDSQQSFPWPAYIQIVSNLARFQDTSKPILIGGFHSQQQPPPPPQDGAAPEEGGSNITDRFLSSSTTKYSLLRQQQQRSLQQQQQDNQNCTCPIPSKRSFITSLQNQFNSSNLDVIDRIYNIVEMEEQDCPSSSSSSSDYNSSLGGGNNGTDDGGNENENNNATTTLLTEFTSGISIDIVGYYDMVDNISLEEFANTVIRSWNNLNSLKVCDETFTRLTKGIAIVDERSLQRGEGLGGGDSPFWGGPLDDDDDSDPSEGEGGSGGGGSARRRRRLRWLQTSTNISDNSENEIMMDDISSNSTTATTESPTSSPTSFGPDLFSLIVTLTGVCQRCPLEMNLFEQVTQRQLIEDIEAATTGTVSTRLVSSSNLNLEPLLSSSSSLFGGGGGKEDHNDETGFSWRRLDLDEDTGHGGRCYCTIQAPKSRPRKFDFLQAFQEERDLLGPRLPFVANTSNANQIDVFPCNRTGFQSFAQITFSGNPEEILEAQQEVFQTIADVVQRSFNFQAQQTCDPLFRSLDNVKTLRLISLETEMPSTAPSMSTVPSAGLLLPVEDTTMNDPIFLTSFTTRQHQVAGDLYLVSERVLEVRNYVYDGLGPAAYFWIDTNPEPTQFGTVVADGYPSNGCATDITDTPLRSANNITQYIELPDGMSIMDYAGGSISVWCEAFAINFGEAPIPVNLASPPNEEDILDCFEDDDEEEELVPAPIAVTPDGYNCEPLNEFFQVRWQIDGDDLNVELLGRIDEGQYMGFGISGKPQNSTFMIGADAVVADITESGPRARDIYLDSRSQCAVGTGVCPDTDGGFTNGVSNVSSEVDSGLTLIRYKRPLVPADLDAVTNGGENLDMSIPAESGINTYVVWAIGPVSPAGFPLFHEHWPSSDVSLDFGRPVFDNCQPLAFVSETEAPTVTPPPPFDRPLVGDSDGSTTFDVHIGPSGGPRGYTAITGKPSWGVAWYVNGFLIPKLVLRRNTTYTFRASGGDDPSNGASYHPFYLTDNPEGGYVQQTAEARLSENVIAGIDILSANVTGVYEYEATLVAPICEYSTTPATEGSQLEDFGDYFATLDTSCASDPNIIGQAAELEFTPDETTPDRIYYQCVTHKDLGFEIEVIDEDAAPVTLLSGSAAPKLTSAPSSSPSSGSMDRRKLATDGKIRSGSYQARRVQENSAVPSSTSNFPTSAPSLSSKPSTSSNNPTSESAELSPDLITSLATGSPTSRGPNLFILLFEMTGTCNGCPSDTALFDEVTPQRRSVQSLDNTHEDMSLGERSARYLMEGPEGDTCGCRPNARQGGVIIEDFSEELNERVINEGVKGIEKSENVDELETLPPTMHPSNAPSLMPSTSAMPTISLNPTDMPSINQTLSSPASNFTSATSSNATFETSLQPSANGTTPTTMSSLFPSGSPSVSAGPSAPLVPGTPTSMPSVSQIPSAEPSFLPSPGPSSAPSTSPSEAPSPGPTAPPTSPPPPTPAPSTPPPTPAPSASPTEAPSAPPTPGPTFPSAIFQAAYSQCATDSACSIFGGTSVSPNFPIPDTEQRCANACTNGENSFGFFEFDGQSCTCFGACFQTETVPGTSLNSIDGNSDCGKLIPFNECESGFSCFFNNNADVGPNIDPVECAFFCASEQFIFFQTDGSVCTCFDGCVDFEPNDSSILHAIGGSDACDPLLDELQGFI